MEVGLRVFCRLAFEKNEEGEVGGKGSLEEEEQGEEEEEEDISKWRGLISFVSITAILDLQ